MSILSSYLSPSKELDTETITTNDDDTDGLVVHKSSSETLPEQSTSQEKSIDEEKKTISEPIPSEISEKDSSSSNNLDETQKQEESDSTDDDKQTNDEDQEYEYIYVVSRNKIPIAYIDDEERLQDYISDIKTRILREHKQLYNLKYIWTDVLKYDLDRDCIVKFSLSSINTNSITLFYSIEDIVEIYRVTKIVCNF